MKVIFTHDVGGVGRRDEIKDVTDGHALNFLIPNGHAIQATPERVKALQERLLTEKRAEDSRNQKAIQGLERLRGVSVRIVARANPSGGLYQILTPALVASALQREFGIHIPPDNIEIPNPIKSVGNWPVTINHNAMSANITVSVQKNG